MAAVLSRPRNALVMAFGDNKFEFRAAARPRPGVDGAWPGEQGGRFVLGKPGLRFRVGTTGRSLYLFALYLLIRILKCIPEHLSMRWFSVFMWKMRGILRIHLEAL